MSTKKDTIQLDIIVGANKARQEMMELEGDIKKLNKELNKLPEGSTEAANAIEQIAAKRARLQELRNEIGLDGMSMKELKNRARELQLQLNNLDPRTDKWKESRAEMTQVQARMSELNGKAQGVSFSFGKIADGFNKYLGVVAAGAAAFTGFALGVKGAVDAANNYEEKVANLSALTGLTGSNLKWLSDQAKEMSTSTVAGNIRITKSADDIAEAFTIVGSKRPELLGNKEALKKVTEQALILAEAGKMETAPAIEAVTAAMNQFNLGADQSSRIINTLAAGSLAGSAEVSDLAGSMKNVGTVAKDSNMSLEQTTAALEVLASKQILGEEAGTKLRGSLLKMKEAGVGYTSGQFNMADAIDEVNQMLAQHTSAAEQDAIKQRVFGTENITVGSILLQNKKAYEDLTIAVTGTNTAYKQAHTNTDIAKAKLAQAKNEFHNTTIEIGERLNPAMATSINIVNKLLQLVIIIPAFVKKWGFSVVYLTTTIALLTIAVNAQIIAKKALIAWDAIVLFWNTAVRASFIKLWAAMAANPIIAIVSGITILIGVIIDLTRRSSEAAAAQRAHRQEIEQTKKAIDELVKKGSNVEGMDNTQIDGYIEDLNRKILLLKHRQVDALNAARSAKLGGQKDALGKNMKEDSGFSYGESIAKLKELNALLQKAKQHKRELDVKEKNNNTNTTQTTNTSAPDSKSAKDPFEDAYATEKNTAEKNANKLLAIEKGYYNASLKGTNDYSKQKQEVTDRYGIKDISNKEAYQLRLIDAEVTGLEERKALAERYQLNDKKNVEKYSKEISDLNDAIETKKQEREERFFSIADEQRKRNFQKQENDLKTKYANGELSEEEYNNALLLAKDKYFDAEIAAYKNANKETYDLEQQKFDNSIALINLAVSNKNKLLSKEFDAEEMKIKNGEKYASRSLFMLSKQYKNEAALLKKKKDAGLITEEEYQQKMGDLAGRTFDAKMALVNNYAEQAGGIMFSFLSGQSKDAKQYLKTMIDMALDALEAQLLVQQVSVTAQSVAQPDSIATFGATGLSRALIINGLIHAAFAAAKAGINSAFYTGGYTGDGHPLEPAGTVHKGEYVIPTFVMSEPSVVRQVQVLENIRREKLGYAIGGSVTGSSSTNSTALPQFTGQNDTLQALNSTIAALNTIIASGIDAKIDYAHHTNQLNKMDKVKSIAKHG